MAHGPGQQGRCLLGAKVLGYSGLRLQALSVHSSGCTANMFLTSSEPDVFLCYLDGAGMVGLPNRLLQLHDLTDIDSGAFLLAFSP